MPDRGQLASRTRSLLEDPGSFKELEALLVSNSNLPGPRGNLELASDFAGQFGDGASEAQWQLLRMWLGITEGEAPVGDPREYLPFVALQALGSAYPRLDDARKSQALESIKAAAGDGRWRPREGVAMAFQRIAERDFGIVREVFTEWMDEASLEDRRVIAAALAHPPILKSPENARYCLRVADRLMVGLTSMPEAARKSEGFRILRQALEYTLSVFVAALPEDGFALLERWARSSDPDARRIVKSNLGKGRLKRYEPELQRVLALL